MLLKIGFDCFKRLRVSRVEISFSSHEGEHGVVEIVDALGLLYCRHEQTVESLVFRHLFFSKDNLNF